MAAPTFNQTNYINLIDLADSSGSNWSVSDVDTDIKVEGIGAHYDAIRDSGTLTYSFGTSQDMSATNTHIRVWFQHTFPSYLQTKANGGLRLNVIDSSSNTNSYYVSGSDQHKGSWELLQADLSSPDIDGSANLASIDEFQIQLVHATAARNVDNTYWDVSWFGIGINFYGGTSGDKVTWNTLASADTGLTSSKQYGIIEWVRQGAYYLSLGLWIGDAASTNDTYFDGTNETIIFYNANEKSGAYKLIGQGNTTGTTSIDFSGSVISSSSTPFIFDMSNTNLTTLTMDGANLKNSSSCLFKTGQEISSVVFTNCSSINPDGADLINCNFINSLVITDTLNILDGCSFTSSGTGHGVNLGTITTTQSMSWDCTDTGYTASSSGNETILVSVNNGVTLTINVGEGASTPSVYNTGTGTVNVVASFSYTVTGLELNTEVTFVTAGTSTELYHVENATTSDGNGKYQVTYNHGGGATVDILVHHKSYKPDISNIYGITLPSANTSAKITMFADENYYNPT